MRTGLLSWFKRTNKEKEMGTEFIGPPDKEPIPGTEFVGPPEKEPKPTSFWGILFSWKRK